MIHRIETIEDAPLPAGAVVAPCWQCGGTGKSWAYVPDLKDNGEVVCPNCKGAGAQVLEVEAIVCATCGTPSVDRGTTLGLYTSDGFMRHHPVCGHPVFYTCRTCMAKAYPKCPVCGCEGEYTR